MNCLGEGLRCDSLSPLLWEHVPLGFATVKCVQEAPPLSLHSTALEKMAEIRQGHSTLQSGK